MRPPKFPLSLPLAEKIRRLLPEQAPDLFLAGDETDYREPVGSPIARVSAFRFQLEQHLHTIIDQAEELDDSDYFQQARGEVIATLIALRELWYLFPELWSAHATGAG